LLLLNHSIVRKWTTSFRYFYHYNFPRAED